MSFAPAGEQLIGTDGQVLSGGVWRGTRDPVEV